MKPMSTIETNISNIYEKVRHLVGTEYNGAFVPEKISSGLAQEIHEQYGVIVPADYFMPAFWLKEVPLYPDANDFLLKLGQQENSLSVIFTQGQVFDKDLLGDRENLGFQNHKIQVSGIPWYFSKSHHDQLKKRKLSLVYGGFNKTDKEILMPILETVNELQLKAAYFDDLPKNLDEVGSFFRENNTPIDLFFVNRAGKEYKEGPLPATEIQTFADVAVESLDQSLVMLDYDGTVGDSVFMRNYLQQEVLKYASLLLKDI
ncbi:hypothetical protein BH09PAT2_BH09PAT2_03920 [soil metagenome]